MAHRSKNRNRNNNRPDVPPTRANAIKEVAFRGRKAGTRMLHRFVQAQADNGDARAKALLQVAKVTGEPVLTMTAPTENRGVDVEKSEDAAMRLLDAASKSDELNDALVNGLRQSLVEAGLIDDPFGVAKAAAEQTDGARKKRNPRNRNEKAEAQSAPVETPEPAEPAPEASPESPDTPAPEATMPSAEA